MSKLINYNIDLITSREIEILELLSHGHSSVKIATALCLSSHTVNDHRKSLKAKLGAGNVAEMIRKGFEYKLLNIHNQQLIRRHYK